MRNAQSDGGRDGRMIACVYPALPAFSSCSKDSRALLCCAYVPWIGTANNSTVEWWHSCCKAEGSLKWRSSFVHLGLSSCETCEGLSCALGHWGTWMYTTACVSIGTGYRVPLFKNKNEENQTRGLHSNNCYDASFEKFSMSWFIQHYLLLCTRCCLKHLKDTYKTYIPTNPLR